LIVHLLTKPTIFSLVFAISKVKRNKYGAVFLGFPGINTYFGDVTPEDSFSVGFKIYTQEEQELFPLLIQE